MSQSNSLRSFQGDEGEIDTEMQRSMLLTSSMQEAKSINCILGRAVSTFFLGVLTRRRFHLLSGNRIASPRVELWFRNARSEGAVFLTFGQNAGA